MKHKNNSPEEKHALVGSVIGNGKLTARDIVGRDKYEIHLHLSELVENEAENDALSDYLTRMVNACDHLDLTAIIPENQISKKMQMELSQVYIPIYVSEKVAYGEDQHGNTYRVYQDDLATTDVNIVGGWEMVPMLADEFIQKNRKSILLGDRGSGKTAYVNNLMFKLATIFLNAENESTSLTRIFQEPVLPIKVDIGKFASSNYFGPNASDIWNYLQSEMGILLNAIAPLRRFLSKGNAFIAFDGLDILGSNQSSQAIAAIKDFCDTFSKNRILITCHLQGREKDILTKFEGFVDIKVAPFSPEQSESFVLQWYAEAKRKSQDILGNEDALLAAIQRKNLAALARSPLLLTQLALLQSSSNHLPNSETDLYSKVIKLLLDKWNKNTPEVQSLKIYLGNAADGNIKFNMALSELAFISYEAKGTLPISLDEILTVMSRYLENDWGKVQKFCEYVKLREGLLVEQDGKYTFPHETFHEYLAANHLSEQGDFISRSIDLVKLDPDKWRRIFILAVIISGIDKGLTAINGLCYMAPSTTVDEFDKLDTTHWKRVLIAAEALKNLDREQIVNRAERLHILSRIVEWLKILVINDYLDLQEVIDAGNILGELGDSREGVTEKEPKLILIPKGSVLITPPQIPGVDRSKNYEYEINYDYWISRFPVTQMQYAYFIAENPSYPVPQGNRPYDWDLPNRTPPEQRKNHPVVLISWYDAKVYCRWLHNHLEKKGLIPDGYEVRIPTEPEWEKAMRGGVELLDGTVNPIPNRIYPWGNEPKARCANLKNIKPGCVDETTPVGIFPKGASPYNILDMAGNVMEWIQTSWGSEDDVLPGFPTVYNPDDGRDADSAIGYKILRGGSWLFPEGEVQCSCRLDPDVRFADVGMRIVIAPKINTNLSKRSKNETR